MPSSVLAITDLAGLSLAVPMIIGAVSMMGKNFLTHRPVRLEPLAVDLLPASTLPLSLSLSSLPYDLFYQHLTRTSHLK